MEVPGPSQRESGAVGVEEPFARSTPCILQGSSRCVLRVRGATSGRVVSSPAVISERGVAYVFLRTLVRDKKRVTIMLASRLQREGGQDAVHHLGQMVVIKATDRRFVAPARETAQENPYHEIAAMRLLGAAGGHCNVLPLLDAMEDDDYIYTVLPYVPGGDLYYRVRAKPEPFSLSEARCIFVGVCRAILFMKQQRIAHRDISLENVVMDGAGCAQLIDFGMCLRVPSCASGHVVLLAPQPPAGKASYLSPEVARQEAFDPFAADVWSLGVLLHILLTQTPLYTSPDDHAFNLMASGQVELLLDHYATLGVSLPCTMARDLVAWMCAADPRQRPTVEQVLAHPWACPVGSPPPQQPQACRGRAFSPSTMPSLLHVMDEQQEEEEGGEGPGKATTGECVPAAAAWSGVQVRDSTPPTPRGRLERHVEAGWPVDDRPRARQRARRVTVSLDLEQVVTA